ncbi:hypothetical protein PHYPSEUDO_001027 [Phytophthora pseudosyringae]|uniref:Transmembrane protein n=1 Tax=Phytophthora pseudosyringae TaxID=221518 RepID=A0A8T1V5B3_9STRA|nr:hypothetical protein PHYPSEUDO_001027 [Phytophthora pseudosyringae]
MRELAATGGHSESGLMKHDRIARRATMPSPPRCARAVVVTPLSVPARAVRDSAVTGKDCLLAGSKLLLFHYRKVFVCDTPNAFPTNQVSHDRGQHTGVAELATGAAHPSLRRRLRTPGSRALPPLDTTMGPLVVAALGVAFVAVIVALFVQARRRPPTAAETDSSDDETSGPLSVNVEADHGEQDSLLPKFAGLLRSPWHSVTTGQKEQPKMMRPVRKGSRSMSFTMPLPLRKKRKPAEVPVKKIHVPYFFPLLDETAEWWQAQQSTAAEPQLTPKQEPEPGPERHPELPSNNQSKREAQASVASLKAHYFAPAKLAATPI